MHSSPYSVLASPILPLATRHSLALLALIDLGLPLGEPLVASWTHHSPIPSTCKSSDELSNTAAPPCILGVDEAGRGPVLGPMVYGICYAAFSEQDFVAKLGVDDSKVLTEPMRNPLFESMQLPHQRERIGWAVKVLSPQDLSNWMLRTAKYNLNAIAHDTTIGLIKETLARGVNVKEVYVDTVGPPEKYQDKLSRIFPGIQFTVTKKADSLFPIVSAASICAKVIRDAVLLHWRFSESIAPINRDELTYSPGLDANNSNSSPWSTQFGSGYPSDPNTVKWLHGHLDPVFGYPGIIRFSWATCEKLVNAKGVEVKW
ncbi:ribonuclease H-like domain-containing protein [Dimargaris cristalligena]|uniref:Ribonuclease n=1 Tax=Dimargaris cristalligena TaxID=215637 RepID=A0A4P9ZU96_9FUNG|nr:ribonuclease H-like domain-containing protein [Dimargaris cristalligena]|eukprot:RKP36431.1 ribonuclease H-like domain-containing protein [Dimargaris cristalligena]